MAGEMSMPVAEEREGRRVCCGCVRVAGGDGDEDGGGGGLQEIVPRIRTRSRGGGVWECWDRQGWGCRSSRGGRGLRFGFGTRGLASIGGGWWRWRGSWGVGEG